MAEFPNKFQNMVDEMNRFEEEIGLPYVSEMPPGQIPSQPFVLGTDTFSQAQRKILGMNHGDDLNTATSTLPSFIPAQVLHTSQANPLPGGIPPPPPPPLSMPPAGMRFPPGIPIPYSQPITTPSPAAAFPNSLLLGPESVASSATATPVSSTAFVRRPPAATWTNRNPNFRPLPPKPETKASDETPKVVLSATPKLYMPKVEKIEDLDQGMGMSSRLVGLDIPKSSAEIANLAKKAKSSEVSKYSPVTSYISAIDAAQADKKKDRKQKKFIRVSGGQTWEDPTLTEWDDGDFRLFCGDLGNDVTDELLTRIFSRYPSFSKAKVVRDKRTNKTKGFGFVSFKDPQDFIRASKEMNGRYVGSRPIKLRKSTWKNRNMDVVKKKEKEKAALIALLTGKS